MGTAHIPSSPCCKSWELQSDRMSACSMMAWQSSCPHRETLLSPKQDGTQLPIGNGPWPILMSKLELCPHNAGRELAGLSQNHARGHLISSSGWVTGVRLCSDTVSLTSLDIAEEYTSYSRKTTAQGLPNRQRIKNVGL